VSTPLTGQVHAFTAGGARHVLAVAEEAGVAMPADVNVVYPPFLDGEPALLACDIAVGRPAGDAAVVAIDITGL
jgi:hypothetical protein